MDKKSTIIYKDNIAKIIGIELKDGKLFCLSVDFKKNEGDVPTIIFPKEAIIDIIRYLELHI